MLLRLLERLKDLGRREAYLKVAASNLAMQRSMSKTPFQRIGLVYTFSFLGKVITVWDRKENRGRKPIANSSS